MSHELLNDEERLRLIEENVRDYAILVMNPRREILSWNVGAERILGHGSAEVLGRSGDLIFTDDDLVRGVPDAEARRAIAEGRTEDERWHVRKDRSCFWASGAMTALRDEHGDLRGFAKILRDRT